MNRRQLLRGGLAWPLAHALPASAKVPIPIADMHYHLLFFGHKSAEASPLAPAMAAGGATLVAWSLIGDLPWMGVSPRGFRQKATPRAGETVDWLEKELARVKAHLAAQGIKIVREAGDVDRALAGEPHVVLSVEGASFLDEGLEQVQAAYDRGIRHIQLVHFIRNTVGDFQTERPVHGGLTDYGRKVIEECNRLGILLDLAHSTSATVEGALALSKAPMVWSHSSVTRERTPHWMMAAWQARQLTLDGAKAIASKGGVVGLWGLRSDVGATPVAYADRLAEMADWLGEDHAAFGSDMNGLASPAIASFSDLRRVVEHWQRRGLGEARVRKLAAGNYARVLKQALGSRQV